MPGTVHPSHQSLKPPDSTGRGRPWPAEGAPVRALWGTAIGLGLVGLYFAAGKLGLRLAFVNASASAVWPPTGIALAAFLVLGNRVWPAILAAAFLTNITTAGNAATSLGIAIGNTLEGFLGAHLIRRYAGGAAVVERPSTIFRFAVLAGILATMVSATIGVTTLVLGGFAAWGEYGRVWLTWWLGDVAGALVVAPFLLAWSRSLRIRWTRGRLLEGILMYAALVLTGLFVFAGLTPFEHKNYPLQYICFPPLIWAAFRFGHRESATAILLLSTIAIGGTLRGIGPFSGHAPNESLLLLQGFLAVISVLSLAVAAAVEGRKQAEAAVRGVNVELESRVAERTQQIWIANRDLRNEIQKRGRAQQRLEKSEARLREAQRVAHLGSWEWDIERNALWWSDELYAIYGVDPHHFKASYEGFLERVHPDDREMAHGLVTRALSEARPFIFEHRILRPNGDVRSLLAQGDVIVDKRGKPVRMMGTGQDITEHKQRAQEQATLLREQTARREAEEANRFKDEFLATLSHELRTPLNAIVGWASLLRDGKLDPETSARAVETIIRNVRIQSHLISDILDISRMTVGQLELTKQPVDLASVLESALDTMKPTAHAKRVLLVSRLLARGKTLRGDPDRLLQVVWNLLSNAIKFTPEGGRVLVTYAVEGSHARIAVEDDGPGISPDFLPYVFERFRQLDSSGTRRHGGLGLGLAIVRHLVELHGGTVTAGNREGGGAVFQVMLPLGTEPAEPPLGRGGTASDGVHPAASDRTAGTEAVGAGTGEKSLQGTSILLVEDEADSRELVSMFLSRCGAEVRAVSSCREALRAFAERPPDVLISDIAMPGESGYDLIAQVRAMSEPRSRSVPAIALTAYAGPEDTVRSIRAGYQAHVSKPVEAQDLVRAVQDCIEGKRGASVAGPDPS